MIEISLLNDSAIATYNCTMPANLTIDFLVQNDKELWYESSLISTLLGVIFGGIITLIINIVWLKVLEGKELKRYEYSLLFRVNDMISHSKPTPEEKKLFSEVVLNINFFKLNSHKLIADALSKHLDGKDIASERARIEERLKRLK